MTGNRNNTLNSIRNQSTKVIATDKVPEIKNSLLEECEKELLRLLFNYGDRILEFEEEKIKVNNYILEELGVDNISFTNSFYKEVLKEYSSQIDNGESLDIKYFLHHQDKEIQQLSISFISKKHEISSKWEEKHQIYTGDETKNLEVTISKSVLSLKQAYIKSKISEINDQLKNDDIGCEHSCSACVAFGCTGSCELTIITNCKKAKCDCQNSAAGRTCCTVSIATFN